MLAQDIAAFDSKNQNVNGIIGKTLLPFEENYYQNCYLDSCKSGTFLWRHLRAAKYQAVVSCSPNVYRLGGYGLGCGSTGKLGRAWVGAWHGALVHGWVMWWRCGVGEKYALPDRMDDVITDECWDKWFFIGVHGKVVNAKTVGVDLSNVAVVNEQSTVGQQNDVCRLR